MRTAIVIPARYDSSRLPGKPLLDRTGKPLIRHVWEAVVAARLTDTVIVATDDDRIRLAVEAFGGTAMMTDRNHVSGTDRLAEVARRIDAETIVNVQGDEPHIDPAGLRSLLELFALYPNCRIATLAVPIKSMEDYRSPNCVKVVLDADRRAMLFSRAMVPFVRDGEPDLAQRPSPFLQHLGVYAYRRESLVEFASLPPSTLELLEKLEQNRVMPLGWDVRVATVEGAGRGVDTPEDYERFVRWERLNRGSGD